MGKMDDSIKGFSLAYGCPNVSHLQFYWWLKKKKPLWKWPRKWEWGMVFSLNTSLGLGKPWI